MPSKLTDALFSEPSGRPQALLMLAGPLVLSSLVVYGQAFGDTTVVGSLTMAVSFALSGVAATAAVTVPVGLSSIDPGPPRRLQDHLCQSQRLAPDYR